MFCALESYNASQKYVPQLFIKQNNNEETLINEQKAVEKEIFRFYTIHIFQWFYFSYNVYVSF